MNLMKQLEDIDCYMNHQKQEVYGFCLNALCCHQPQFCFQCCKSIHKSHLQDCQSMNNILRILYDLYEKLESNKDQNQLIHKQLEWILILIKKKSFSQIITQEQKLIKQQQNYIKIIENHFDIIKTQLIQIVELFEMKNYGELRNQIRTLKLLYQFSQNKMYKFSKLLIEILDFAKIIKLNLELNLKLDHKLYQTKLEILELLKKIVNDSIIQNIAFPNSTIYTNAYSLFKLEEEYLPIQFTVQSVQKLKEIEISFNIFEFGITCEDVSSQANEIPQENDHNDSEIFYSKQISLTEPFSQTIQNNNSTICQDIITNNQINLQFVFIEKNIQQICSIKKWIYNIKELNEFSYFDSSDEQNSDNIQNFSNKLINEQSIQIFQENTNQEQNNLNEQEQILLDYQQQQQNEYNNYWLYQTQLIDNVEQYHTIINLIFRDLQFKKQNENEIMINSLDYEDHRNIAIKEINNLKHEQNINYEILEKENYYYLFSQENNNIENIEQDNNFDLDYIKKEIKDVENYQDLSNEENNTIENIEEKKNSNLDYEENRNIEIEEEK